MNINGVKEIYKDFYFEINGSMKRKKLLTELASMMKFRIKSKAP